MMWRKPVAAFVACVFLFLAALGLPTHTYGQRNIFDEEDDAEPVESPAVREATTLAKDVIKNINKSYYRLWRDMPGFEALYLVNKGQETLGKMTVSWKQGEDCVVKFNTPLENKTDEEFLVRYVQYLWTESLLREYKHHGEVAQKTERGFTLTMPNPGADIKESYVQVAEDYHIVNYHTEYNNGTVKDGSFKVQTHGGLHYIESYRESFDDDRVGPDVLCEPTYKTVGKAKVIKRLKIAATKTAEPSAGEATYAISLDETAPDHGFTVLGEAVRRETEVAAADAGDDVEEADVEALVKQHLPDSWDALSGDVIIGMAKRNLDTATIVRYIRKLSCTFKATITQTGTSPMRGTVTYAWEDLDDNGRISDDEMEIEVTYISEGKMRPLMADFKAYLEQATRGGTLDTMLTADIKTKKSGSNYIMTITTGDKDKTKLYATVTSDHRLVKLKGKSKDGLAETTVDYKHVDIGGMWFMTESNEKTVGREYTTTTKTTNTYDWEREPPLVRRVDIVTKAYSGAGIFTITQRYDIGDWEFTPRDEPLEVAATLGAEAEDQPEDEVREWMRRGIGQAKKGKFDEAVGSFTKAIDLNPDVADAYALRAAAYVELGKLDWAIIDAGKAIEVDPHSADGYFVRGNAYGRKKEYGKALEDLSKAIELNPKNWEAYHSRAVAHAGLKEYDKARADVEKCKQLGGKTDPKFMAFLRAAEEDERAGEDVQEEWDTLMEQLLKELQKKQQEDD